MADLERCALLVIDVQRGLDDPRWGRRDNPDCEANIAALIGEWRRQRRTIVFVRHDSREEGSPLVPGTDGNAFKEVLTGTPDLLVVKHVNSAFYGEPDLDEWLRRRDLGSLAICGITTNQCCETTARMAGNLGYDVLFASDATHSFDRESLDGSIVSAEELHRATDTNLQGEFAKVVQTSDLIDI
jgi:nicotinamidase-related amidase